jgi:hypothetical protein
MPLPVSDTVNFTNSPGSASMCADAPGIVQHGHVGPEGERAAIAMASFAFTARFSMDLLHLAGVDHHAFQFGWRSIWMRIRSPLKRLSIFSVERMV